MTTGVKEVETTLFNKGFQALLHRQQSDCGQNVDIAAMQPAISCYFARSIETILSSPSSLGNQAYYPHLVLVNAPV